MTKKCVKEEYTIDSRELKGITFALLTALLSGVSVVVNKIGMTGINPFLFTGIKNMVVGLAIFSLIVLFKERSDLRKLSGKKWMVLVVEGIVGGGIAFLFFFKGLSQTSALSASLIQKSMFLGVAVLAPIFLHEKLDKRFFLGALFLMTGTIVSAGGFPMKIQSGDMLIVAATLLWVMEVVAVKRFLVDIPVKVMAFSRMFFGGLFIAGFLAATGQMSSIVHLTAVNIVWIAVTSLFLGGFVLTWFYGLSHARSSVVTSVLTLGGPISSLVTVFVAGTLPKMHETVGSALLVSGVVAIIGFATLIGVVKRFRLVLVNLSLRRR